jgi:hypothetical protein
MGGPEHQWSRHRGQLKLLGRNIHGGGIGRRYLGKRNFRCLQVCLSTGQRRLHDHCEGNFHHEYELRSESRSDDSRGAYRQLCPHDDLSYPDFIYRATAGAASAGVSGGSGVAPYWVRAVRSGNSFSAFKSIDGVTWTQIGTTQTITMGASVYIGLAVTSKNNSLLNTATFDNVSVTP